jgi:hypothetical protein
MGKYSGRVVTDFAPAGHSVAFDGTGDYLTVPSNVALTLGTGNFCLEFWAYPTSFSATRSWLSNRNGTETNRWGIDSNTSGQFYLYGNGGFVVTSTVQTVNQWVHVCVTRAGTSSNQTRIFINGALSAVGTSSTDFAADVVSIGASPSGSQPAIGNVSNARIIKGSIPTEYTTTSTTVGAQIFSPPTQLFNVTNTSLLTCQNPTIIDNSSNNFTISLFGNAAVSTFTPFAAYAAYNPASGAATPGVWTLDEALQARATRRWNMYDPYFNSTTLLLRSGSVDGSQNNQFLDSGTANGGTGYSITRNGNVTQGTFSPFSQTGWSVNFNRTDYTNIYAASSADFNFGSGDFTIECFFNPSYVPASGDSTFTRLFDTGQLTCFFHSGNIYFRNAANAELVTVVAHGLSVGVWYHLAFVRSGTTYYIFRNGSQLTSGTGGTITSASAPFVIGTNTSYNQPLDGFVSDFRVTNGQALYTTTFTPATTPLTTTSQSATASNVKLLTCQSNRFVDNSTQSTKTILFGNNGANLGTRFVQAFSPFFPTTAYSATTVGGSGYFDYTGLSYLSITTASTNYYSALGDWTWEAWVYPLSFNGPQYSCPIMASSLDSVLIRAMPNSTASSTNINVYAVGGTTPAPILGSGGTSAGTIYLNTWSHVVFQRRSGIFEAYLNGTRIVSDSTQTGTSLRTTDTAFFIGGANAGSNPYWNGYISGVRVQNGSAVYSGTTITIPTAPPSPTGAAVCANFTNAAITDATAKNVFRTVGNAQASTSVRNTRLLTTPPTAVYFDGNGDYLYQPNQVNLQFGTGDYTVEFWIYPNSFSGTPVIIDFRTANAASGGAIQISLSTSGVTTVYGGGATGNLLITAAAAISTGVWTHIALTRNGTSTRLFINGTQSGSTATDSTGYGLGALWIGANASGGSNYLNGYIDDFRITKGVARYTATFTPPRSRLQEQ